MKKHSYVALAFAAIAIALAPAIGAPAQENKEARDLPEREEIHQSYQLAPGARVEVSVVSGSVDVQTVEGNTAEVNTAKVDIVRSARTRAELDCYSVAIDHSPTSLVLRHQQEHTGPCRSISARQRVSLTLPRDVDLTLHAISGPVTLGPIAGNLRLSGLSGKVELEQGLGFSDISGISGNLIVHVSRLGDRGMRVSGISGTAEFMIGADASADIVINGIAGGVGATAPGVAVSQVSESNFRGRIGAGGPPISISGLSGTLAFRADK
jgi:hypothetical protein